MNQSDLRNALKLYAITDSAALKGRSLADGVRQAIAGGITMLQYRKKNADYETMKAEALELQALCREAKVCFIINDHVALAKEIGADGVHLGASDMELSQARELLGENAIIGATAKTIEQALAARQAGADYLGSGAIFGTTTKADALPMEKSTLRAITEAANIPVVAIGGITGENVTELAGTGIAGVAVVGGIFGQDDIKTATRDLLDQVERIILKEDETPTSLGGAQSMTRTSQQVCQGVPEIKTALTIAGSDCSGGAGIQADIKTMISNGVYAMSAITALTAQNTTGVTAIENVTPEFLAAQLDAIFTDLPVDAVKIGMVSSEALIRVIAAKLKQYHAGNVVLDPVMVATSGARLIAEDALEALTGELIPLASVITPNIPEAEILYGHSITNEQDMMDAAAYLSQTYHCAVLLKGGHQVSTANDLLFRDGHPVWFEGKRIDNPNTHGTGCTLSSAIAANLAKGRSMEEAVRLAKAYISDALQKMLNLGHASGPLDHHVAGYDR